MMFAMIQNGPVKLAALVAVVVMILSGCVGGENTYSFPTKNWDDIEVSLETRPPKVRAGMVEFLVMAAVKGRKRESELVVSLRIEGQEKWHQAIQDGFIGVYRRVVRVNDPARDVLAVKLRRKKSDDEKILYFPLAQQQQNSAAAQ